MNLKKSKKSETSSTRLLGVIVIPAELLKVRYNSANFPGAVGFDDLTAGANCQVFAYSLLAHYGFELPPFRSSELWEDCRYTAAVSEFAPLDLLLFHKQQQAFGAHVTVYAGEGHVIHLGIDNGYPAIEPISKLQRSHRYRYFIGAKRPFRSGRDATLSGL